MPFILKSVSIRVPINPALKQKMVFGECVLVANKSNLELRWYLWFSKFRRSVN